MYKKHFSKNLHLPFGLEVCLVALFLFFCFSPLQLARAQKREICVGAGGAGIADSSEIIYGLVEFRPGWVWKKLEPWFSFCATDEEYFASAGGLLKLEIKEDWLLIPSLGAGLYTENHGSDLGSVVEFRSALQIDRQFKSGYRLGFRAAHISNGGMGQENPGAETFALIYTILF